MKTTDMVYNSALTAFQNYCPHFLKNPIVWMYQKLFGPPTNQWCRHLAGAIVDANGYGFLNLMFENANVPPKYRYMFDASSENAVLVDCGANVGLITDIGLFVGMEVYAFEPSKSAFKLLKKKYEHNTKVHLYQQAVSHKAEQVTFFVDECSLYDQGATIVSSGEQHIYNGKQSYRVDCVRLSEVLKKTILSQHKKIHLLKLDVEGAEFAIIEDLIESGVYKEITFIVCETHERFFGKAGTKKLKHLHHLLDKHHIENIFLDWV